jgi:ribA/ribD-fused uncharacterized protein
MTADRAICGFTGAYRWLSNFAPVSVVYDGDTYPSIEHAYQAAKTTDRDYRRAIACLTDPAAAKRATKGFKLGAEWHDRKGDIMYSLLVQKFAQEPYRSQLEATQDWHLVETNTWGDTFWGVCNGTGENRLGRLLEQVRDRNRLTPR